MVFKAKLWSLISLKNMQALYYRMEGVIIIISISYFHWHILFLREKQSCRDIDLHTFLIYHSRVPKNSLSHGGEYQQLGIDREVHIMIQIIKHRLINI